MKTDSQLQQAVLAELKWAPSVTAAHIGVAAHAGVITLTGHVETYPEKHAAEEAAIRVKGVKAVAEEIEVRLPFETKRSDEAIAAAAIERLSWDVSIPKDAVMVKVEKGWVTISGQVDHYYQRSAPEYDIRSLIGVMGVSNQITIKPQVDASDISENIMHALHRSWFFDPKTIQVNFIGGHVKLTGTATSYHDKEVAASTAWMAPGVTSVDNKIAVL
jgi:osmotically-inducible protein OsmY